MLFIKFTTPIAVTVISAVVFGGSEHGRPAEQGSTPISFFNAVSQPRNGSEQTSRSEPRIFHPYGCLFIMCQDNSVYNFIMDKTNRRRYN